MRNKLKSSQVRCWADRFRLRIVRHGSSDTAIKTKKIDYVGLRVYSDFILTLLFFRIFDRLRIGSRT